MRLITLLTLVLFCVLPAQAQTPGEKRAYFKDWLAACKTDTGYCSAISYINPNPGNGAVADHWLRVGRNKSNDKWEISITPILTMPSNTTTFYFWVGEESFWFTKGDSALAYGAINDIFLLNNDATKLLSAMLAGNRLKASFDDQQGRRVDIEFSLSGLTAALLWIDEQQGRVGDARVAGDIPKGLELAEPKLPLPEALPNEIIAKHAKNENCDPLTELVHGEDWQVHQVNNSTLLYMVPCSAGAYNFSYAFYRQSVDNGDISKLLFVDYWDSLGWTGTDVLFNAGFDPQTRILTSYYKGRGLGDCGTAGEWQWQEYGFKMLKFFAKSECDGYADDADMSFPQIFP
ncbi:DUF1176 domain-containing protein [uncultured Maritalea sp.]|uniref:DUF1176 domain-containing protein n=1 Tax=uncultured Maritalea sp. TaxID=757249 RepID=UPI002602FBDF|nr:DUF1176 domain-containing protein [uncultured Maritalea sp.]